MMETAILGLIGNALLALAGGLLTWAAKTLYKIDKQVAVHAEKHDRHDKRLEILEARPNCHH